MNDKEEWLRLAFSPISGEYTVSVRVVLWNYDRTKILLVLEKGDPNGKPRGRGLPGGKVKIGETPWAAAWRELREEANILKEEISFDIGKLPILVKAIPAEHRKNKEKKLHFEIYFFGQITDPFIDLPEIIKTQDVISKVIEARWVNFYDLPSVRQNQKFLLNERIYFSHLDMVYQSVGESIEELNKFFYKYKENENKKPAQV